ncbi:hypothetical protein IQ249_14320 [Lusitaniella coriacea LEGE 07157]|uniref:Uncharacterized protein n=1 Tax=Lusitaniella coriacea LEGE 07157 TaxID=945747 RepID=A0A8J7IV90_9CYAN|nr:hypothetical protein [Lusitaniella coriacea]MBE9117073.1 hypothetical protein [Lusitaniella coriacea LEGE 07157]
MQTKENIVIDNIKKYGDSLDLDYLVNIVNNLSFAELEESLCRLLKSQDRNKISETCFIVRDLVVCGNRYSELTEFREKYPKSLIVKTLESLLSSSDRNTVKDAIYTLGKTCSHNSISALKKAFYYLQDTDPLILSRLFCEMQWLGLDNYWELIDSMMSSDVCFTRWAVIDLLPIEIEGNGEKSNILLQPIYNCLEQLKRDSYEVIRIETEYKYLWINFKLIASTLCKAERRKQRKKLEKQYQSILSFNRFSRVFNYYLDRKNMDSYTIYQLHTFFDYFVFFEDIYKGSL